MYENITYAELKSLPKEQKPDAWRELKSMYSTQKELAEKLGVSPNIVYNMIAKYVGTEKRDSKLEVVDTPEKRKGKAGRRSRKAGQSASLSEPASDAANDIPFSISIKKNVTGEDAQYILNGIGVTLLKNQKYSIEVRIAES